MTVVVGNRHSVFTNTGFYYLATTVHPQQQHKFNV